MERLFRPGILGTGDAHSHATQPFMDSMYSRLSARAGRMVIHPRIAPEKASARGVNSEFCNQLAGIAAADCDTRLHRAWRRILFWGVRCRNGFSSDRYGRLLYSL